LPIGNDEAPRIGDWVLAFGIPSDSILPSRPELFQRSQRVVKFNCQTLVNFRSVISLQTDAAINPGNRVDRLSILKGEAIGLNSAIASETGYYSGYGFADSDFVGEASCGCAD